MNYVHTTTKTTRSMTTFFGLTALLSVPIVILAAVTKPLIPEGMPINHLGFIMVIVPGTTALMLTYRENGRESAKQLFMRVFDHNRITKKGWYIPIVFLLPIIYVSLLGVLIRLGVQDSQISIPISAVLILFPLFLLFAACEEVGWMGYAFEPMESRWNALNAGIVLGIIGATWHFPLFVIQNPPGGFLWIAGQWANAVVIRILAVWIFNNTGKSVFAMILFHAIYNLCTMVLPVYNSPFGPLLATLFIIGIVGMILYLWGADTLAQFKFPKKDQSSGQ